MGGFIRVVLCDPGEVFRERKEGPTVDVLCCRLLGSYGELRGFDVAVVTGRRERRAKAWFIPLRKVLYVSYGEPST